MSAKVFVDTNVLVYARYNSEPEKQQKAMAWMTPLWTSQAGRLSFQILHEFYSTVTQKLHPGMDLQSARNDVQSLFAWHPTYVGADTIQSGMVDPGPIQTFLVGFPGCIRRSDR